jgi:hypothetical protein
LRRSLSSCGWYHSGIRSVGAISLIEALAGHFLCAGGKLAGMRFVLLAIRTAVGACIAFMRIAVGFLIASHLDKVWNKV